MTGLDPETCDIIEIAAVIDDLKDLRPLDELPKYHCYVKKPTYRGEPHALAMHKKIFQRIAGRTDGYSYVQEDYVSEDFYRFLCKNGITDGPFTVAGKNFGTFDKVFLDKLPDWKRFIKINHRILDPAVLYFDPLIDDTLPSTQQCLNRAGIKTKSEHTALEDALLVVQLVRHKLVEEYQSRPTGK